MKTVLKGDEPFSLTTYRNAVPASSWEEMKNDPHHGGRQAYTDCRKHSIQDQKGLCAYCEIDIQDNEPLKCRVEHFHPKSDNSISHNWALDWQNMLAVCNGGSNPHVTDSGFHRSPTDENLSCDAHKDRMIQSKRLAENCEGWILNPLQIKAFPTLFLLEKSTGFLKPNSVVCAAQDPWLYNHHESLEKLVQHTIDMLNLNCDRKGSAGRSSLKPVPTGFSFRQGTTLPFGQPAPSCVRHGIETPLRSASRHGYHNDSTSL